MVVRGTWELNVRSESMNSTRAFPALALATAPPPPPLPLPLPPPPPVLTTDVSVQRGLPN
ncbi:hypothetical protein Dsin_030764 [Dipteronia sinensis]|uniref:Uncharacterized protein n=1 Tax=Dipteronia sinensis TaxID=43782 RepID=A0AAD9ZKP1_9ROSI|nr:hypothetical protein Dsin_030764 [Dipteronia sinensis]